MGRFKSASSLLLVAALAVMFMGCGETTTSEAAGDGVPAIVKTFEDLPNCAQGKFAQVYYVMEEEQFYACGYSTENPNQYGYHVIDPPDDTCTVEDNGDGTKTVRCTDGTDVTFVTVNDVACVHDIDVCEDGDACTDHGCDPALGCHSWPTTCDDGDACTVNGCDSATGCDYSEPVVCDDGNACTANVCVSPTGCEFEPNVFCPAGSECDPDNGECVLLPVCPCFTESDMNMYYNYFRRGYSLSYYYCIEWEAGYSEYAPRLYLRSSMNNSRVYVGYAINPLTQERERFCSGSLYRYPYNNWSTITNYENDAGSSYGLLAPRDWEKCWQNVEDKIDLIGVQCTVYAPEECAPGLVWCNGACIDPQISEAFCGASGDCLGPNRGAACGDNGSCVEGTCECAPGLVWCNGACIDPQISGAFCGASGDCLDPNAGVACGDGEVCAQGTCGCEPGHVSCDGACIDPQISEVFCGASGDCLDPNAGVACGDGEVCLEGICQPPILVYSSLFTLDVAPTAEQCSDWQTFRDGLTGAYASVRIYGSQNETGYTCTDPDAVAQIAAGLQTRTAFFVICDGNSWSQCTTWEYGGGHEFWVRGPSLCNTSEVCNYDGGLEALLRPCVESAGSWGGVDTPFCHGPTQTITVEFF